MNPMRNERLARLWEEALTLASSKPAISSDAFEVEVEERLARLWEPCFSCEEVSAPDHLFAKVQTRLAGARASSTASQPETTCPNGLAEGGLLHTVMHREVWSSPFRARLAAMSAKRRHVYLLAALMLLLAVGYACFMLMGRSEVLPTCNVPAPVGGRLSANDSASPGARVCP